MRTLLVLALVSCKKSTPVEGPPSATIQEGMVAAPDASLVDFFARTHTEDLATDPSEAAYRGEPHDETQWTDSGEDRHAFVLAQAKRWMEEAAVWESAELTNEEQLSLTLFLRDQQETLDNDIWRDHRFPVTHIRGTHTWIPSFLTTVHRIDDAETARSWIERLRNAVPVLDETVVTVKRQAAKGIRPPAYSYPQIHESIDNLLTGAPFDDGPPSPLFTHYTEQLAPLELADEDALKAEVAKVLVEDLAPAYRRLQTFLAEDAPNAKNAGAWALPDGAAYYRHRLGVQTTTDLTPEQIHQLGLDEVARIQDEMRTLMPAVGVEGDLPELFAHLRTSPKYTLADDDAGRSAYLALAQKYVDGMEAVLPEVFEHLPAAPLEVRRVPEWTEKSAGKAYYQPPSTDGSRPGIFYANLGRMEDVPTYQLEALVYHEGIPGHHMQNAVSQRLEHLPAFRRFGHYTAYGEGWGLYAEYMPKELGFYTEPSSDVGRLAMELWRAARLVVDSGLHHKQWTRERAIEYLMTNTPNPEGDAVKAIERYMVWPGQATAYKVGMLEILRMRSEAKAALGDRFDLRGFHGVVLGTGPVPLAVLDAQVDAWVAALRD